MTRRLRVRIAGAIAMFTALFLLTAPARAETPDPPDADSQSQTTTAVTQVTGTAPPAPPVALLKFGDNSLRFGTVLQSTYDATQDPNTSGYTQNFYMRRVRFYMLGKLGKQVGPGVNEVEFFFQTDNPRTGNAGLAGPKNTGSTGLLVQDAYAQWALGGNALALQAGFWIVPTVRQEHTSVVTFLSMDLATWVLQQNTVLQGNGGRDYGVGFNGYLLDDHFSYRVGVFSGQRQATSAQPAPLGVRAAGRNSLRFAGRFMYDFFDSEKGYTYMGTYLCRKKVVAVGAVADVQGSFEAFGGDFFVDWPVGPGAVTFEADYIHYSGWGKFYNGVPEEQSFFGDVGYYFSEFNIQPFFRFEKLTFHAAANAAKEQERFAAGLNYYVMWQNFKITPYYERVMPKVQPATAKIKDTNRFLVQIQAYL